MSHFAKLNIKTINSVIHLGMNLDIFIEGNAEREEMPKSKGK